MEFFLSSPVSEEQGFTQKIGTELSKISSKLIPNFFSFAVQLLALLVVIIIIMVVLYKPVKKTLVARNDYIERQIQEAKENNVLSEQNRVQAEQDVIDARKKSSDIIAEANKIA